MDTSLAIKDASLAIGWHRGPKSGKVQRMVSPASTPNSDDPIAAQLQNDDPEAMQALWDEHGDTVYAVAMRGIGDPGAAEDVRQQVFAELWERRASYDPQRGPVRAWVLTIARSRTIDHLRRRRPAPEEPEAFDRIAAPARAETSPEAVVDRIGVGELLRRIPTEEAGLLRMRFFDELSQTEISARTGIPLGTVKMRMVQALDRLRGMMEAEGAGP
jgi:RNA polymerase sigma-70 factor, ECF subfamily